MQYFSVTDTLLNPSRLIFQCTNIFEKNYQLGCGDKAVTHDQSPGFIVGDYTINIEQRLADLSGNEKETVNYIGNIIE